MTSRPFCPSIWAETQVRTEWNKRSLAWPREAFFPRVIRSVSENDYGGKASVLLNLWDIVLNKYGADLYRIGELIAQLQRLDISEEAAELLNKATFIHAMNLGGTACVSLGLKESAKLIKEVDGRLKGDSLSALAIAQKNGDLRHISRLLRSELESKYFLYVPELFAAFYDKPELFGSTVAKRYPKATYHIQEAGTCYALSRSTACVYHLMCVLDIALDSLANALGLPYSRKNWEQILINIESAIQDIVPNSSQTWKEDKEFYSRAALEFKYFRDAWRNHTAHGRAKYTQDEAKVIIEHVGDFMNHLAGRLSERP